MATASAPAPSTEPRTAAVERWYFTGLALTLIAVSIAGFAPALMHPAARRAPLSFLAAMHGSVFLLWQVLFFVQSRLVATHRVAWHRRLGVAGAVLFAIMIPLGFVTTISMARRGFDLSGDLRVLPRAAPGFVGPITGILFPITDLAIFALLGGAALAFRRRREIHKRMMIFANLILIPAPLAHWIGHAGYDPASPIIMLPIGLFLFSAIARDYLVGHRIHPLTWTLALGMFASGPLRAFVLGPSPAWHRFAAWLIG
jgi:hypothetical protein